MTVEYPDLADYIAVASAVTGTEPDVVSRSMNVDLADSALHAPAGSWSGDEFYPDFVDKAAVLLVRLAKNHPLLDGNRRGPPYPGIDESERAVLAVASSEWDEDRTAAWLRPLLSAPTSASE